MRICIVLTRTHAFSGADFHEGAVGGTQAALVVLAEGFVDQGHDVTVAMVPREDVTCRGVRYCDVALVREGAFDLVLLVRDWEPAVATMQARRRALLLTDVDHADRPSLPPAFDWADCVLLMSSYQDERLLGLLGPTYRDHERVVVGLPVRTDDYAPIDSVREPVLLYCSVPERGLLHLRRIFPAIRRRVPGARLIVTSDHTMWGEPSRRARFAPRLEPLEGVDWRGAVPRPELVRLQREARLLAYPCDFVEGFCLSAAECMASGAVPVTTNGFALTTTVGSSGVLIDGRVGGFFYRRRFVAAAVSLLQDDAAWLTAARAARTDALERHAPGVVCRRFLDAAVADA